MAGKLGRLERFWAIAPNRMTPMISYIGDFAAEIAGKYEWANHGGVAVLPIKDLLVPSHNITTAMYGGTVYGDIADAVRKADSDDSVERIALDIDSPGGAVAGIGEAVEAIKAAGKPVTAYIRSIGASAAYWLAAMADEIVVDPLAEVGSIGVYTVIEDWSALFEAAGVKMHVVSTGPYKGLGIAGTEVTEALIEDTGRVISSMFRQFADAVKSGRKMNDAAFENVATGQVWVGAQSVANRLADRTGTIREIHSNGSGATVALDLRSEAADNANGGSLHSNEEGGGHMDKKNPATVAELKAQFPSSDAEWREKQIEAGASLHDAALSFASYMADKVKAVEAASAAKVAEAEAKAAEAQAAKVKAEADAKAATPPKDDHLDGFNGLATAGDGDDSADWKSLPGKSDDHKKLRAEARAKHGEPSRLDPAAKAREDGMVYMGLARQGKIAGATFVRKSRESDLTPAAK